MSDIRARHVVRVKTGKFAGAVGICTETRANGRVKVRIEGVIDGKAIDEHVTLQAAQCEVIHG